MATIAVFAALTRRKKKTMPTIQPNMHAEPRRDGGSAELLADEAQHVFVARRHGRADLR